MGSKVNTIKTCDNNSGVARPWSDLNHDVLILVMMQLGVVDFLAFGGVCKSWRSLTVCNKNMFMVSRPPMSISGSDANEKQECYLEDFEGTKFKITLPHFAAGRRWRCIGVTGGYLILFCQYGLFRSNDCWLVNLITSHELHFPNVPNDFSNNVFCCPEYFRSIIVFLPSISGWVFVVLNKLYYRLWFCIAGKQEWTQISHHLEILDVIAFKGKIYIVHYVDRSHHEVGICEMRLYPKPKLMLLEIKNFRMPRFINPGFVNSGENLYVIDRASNHPYNIHELDFCEMKLVSREKKGEKYAFFCDDFNDCKTFTLREAWVDIHQQYGRYAVNDKEGNGVSFHAKMWYFLDDCLNVNLIHE